MAREPNVSGRSVGRSLLGAIAQVGKIDQAAAEAVKGPEPAPIPGVPSPPSPPPSPGAKRG